MNISGYVKTSLIDHNKSYQFTTLIFVIAHSCNNFIAGQIISLPVFTIKPDEDILFVFVSRGEPIRRMEQNDICRMPYKVCCRQAHRMETDLHSVTDRDTGCTIYPVSVYLHIGQISVLIL